MNIKETKEYMRERGYTLHSFSGTGKDDWMAFTDDEGICVEVKLADKKCQISFMYKLLSISTGWIQFPHPNFDSIFENQILTASRQLRGR